MKIGFEYIFVIIAFVAIIMLSSYGSSVVVPYQKDDLFSKQFRYEGMETNPVSGNSVSLSNSISSMMNTPLTNSISSMIQQNKEKMLSGSLINETTGKGNTVTSKESFEGMFSLSPYDFNGPDTPLTLLTNSSGGANCDPARAAGYSNSKGPLCIDDSTLQLLRTRGGNQSGAPSQIGQ